MDFKGLMRTKTFWGGLGQVLYGIYLIANGNPQDGIQNVILGLSIIFLRDAIRKGN